jgi:acetyltransferase-like isoleucine patch superfamily enzyme
MKRVLKSSITFFKCRFNKIKSGRNVYIGLDVKIVNRGTCILSDNVIIRPSSDLYVNHMASQIFLGEGTEIGNHSTISSKNQVYIGKNVLTGPHVFIADHNHEYENIDIPICKQGERAKPGGMVKIGDGTWLGTNTVIVGNIDIGKNCVIGANSVVTKDIPDFCVAVGIPARVIRKYNVETKMWVNINSNENPSHK